MIALAWRPRPPGSDGLQGEGVVLRAPEGRDFAAWAELRSASAAFLQPFEPAWASDVLAERHYRARLRRYREGRATGSHYAFSVFRARDGVLLGGVNLGRVLRGAQSSCVVGYWVGQPYARRGHATAALRTALDFAFGPLGLHRVEAACQPENAASLGLLRKVGFREEGLARSYLCINGAWRDHLLFGLVADEWRG